MACEPDVSYCGAQPRAQVRLVPDRPLSSPSGSAVPSARTKRAELLRSGLQVRGVATEPLQREAHAGIGPVAVSRTSSPRAWAPATKESSIANTPAGYAAGFLPSKPFGFFLEFGEGAKRDQITFARITSAPSAFASSSDAAWTAGPEIEHQVSRPRSATADLGRRGRGRWAGRRRRPRPRQEPPGAASGRLSHQGHSNATTGRELRRRVAS